MRQLANELIERLSKICWKDGFVLIGGVFPVKPPASEDAELEADTSREYGLFVNAPVDPTEMFTMAATQVMNDKLGALMQMGKESAKIKLTDDPKQQN